jgi:hypothetical protein
MFLIIKYSFICKEYVEYFSLHINYSMNKDIEIKKDKKIIYDIIVFILLILYVQPQLHVLLHFHQNGHVLL